MKNKKHIDEIKQKLADFKPVMDGLSRARNPFELRYFVIGKHDDRIQQYKQAVVEMEAKYNSVVEGEHSLRLSALEKEELELKKIKNPKTRQEEIDNEKLELEIIKREREEHRTRLGMTGAFKEVMDFIAIIEREYSDLIDKTEEDLLLHEAKHWEARFAKQLAIDKMTYGKIGEGNHSALLSMPKELQGRILEKAMIKAEETLMFENKVAKETLVKLAESYPRPTTYIAPPDGIHIPLKLRKDAPEGYPENKIVNIDRAEIMVATLHRPEDRNLPFPQFYIPAGKNYMTHYLVCEREDMVGEYVNRLVKDALSVGCTHILFVDDDLLIEKDALQKLYAHDLDIVGGWYPMKTPACESSTLISVPNSESKQPVPKDSTGLIEVDWSLARGLTLIKTDVFKKIPYPWYMTIHQGTEDTYFSARCRESGIKCWLDTSVKAMHMDRKESVVHTFDGIKRLEIKNDTSGTR